MYELTVASIKALSIAVLTGLLAASSAWADMRIIQSNVPGIAVGAVFPTDVLPVLPPGGRVVVRYLTTNKTREFVGPKDGSDTRPFGGTRGKQAPN